MDIFKLIHKIRNLTVDDKINLAKKLGLLVLAFIIALAITITSFKVIKNALNSKANNEITEDTSDEEFNHLPELETTDKHAEFQKPSSRQEEEFNLYNCLQFSDISQKNGTISVKIKNTSNFTIKNVSVDLYNSSNQLVTTLSLPANTKIGPNDEEYIEGFANETASVKLYSYLKGNDFITINLINNSAITGDNDTGTVF